MDEFHIILLVIIGLFVLWFIIRSSDSDSEHLQVISRSRTKQGPILVNEYDYGCSCNKNKFIDHFEHFNDLGFEPDFAWLAHNNLLPWWNSTRSTRNSSWDLRGDVPIVKQYVGPWLNSPL